MANSLPEVPENTGDAKLLYVSACHTSPALSRRVRKIKQTLKQSAVQVTERAECEGMCTTHQLKIG